MEQNLEPQFSRGLGPQPTQQQKSQPSYSQQQSYVNNSSINNRPNEQITMTRPR